MLYNPRVVGSRVFDVAEVCVGWCCSGLLRLREEYQQNQCGY